MWRTAFDFQSSDAAHLFAARGPAGDCAGVDPAESTLRTDDES